MLCCVVEEKDIKNDNHGPEVPVPGKKDIVPSVGTATMQKGNLKWAENQIERQNKKNGLTGARRRRHTVSSL